MPGALPLAHSSIAAMVLLSCCYAMHHQLLLLVVVLWLPHSGIHRASGCLCCTQQAFSPMCGLPLGGSYISTYAVNLQSILIWAWPAKR